jgi:hypothetical protein
MSELGSDPGAPYSDDLREFFFSNGPDVIALDTFELRHPAFVAEDGVTPAAARIVNDPNPLTVTLPDDAPMNAGEAVTFTECRVEVTLPESNSPGTPSCQVAIENVGQVLMDPIERAVAVPKPIEVTYRQVLVPSDDLTAPGEIGVEIDGMTLRQVNATALRVTGTAGFDDDLNTPFPRKKYTPQEYGGLVRS